jgi:hypothetical protein
VPVALDEGGGGAAASVDMIHRGRQVAHGAVPAVGRDVGGEGGLAVLGEDVGEAVPGDRGRRAEVPFAKLGRDVAGLLQAGGKGGFAVEALERVAVAVDPEAALELADHQAGARRHTLRRGAVAVPDQYAAAGEGIDMRGLDVGEDSLNPKVGMAVVVGVEDDEVGFGRRLQDGRHDGRRQQEGENGSFADHHERGKRRARPKPGLVESCNLPCRMTFSPKSTCS